MGRGHVALGGDGWSGRMEEDGDRTCEESWEWFPSPCSSLQQMVNFILIPRRQQNDLTMSPHLAVCWISQRSIGEFYPGKPRRISGLLKHWFLQPEDSLGRSGTKAPQLKRHISITHGSNTALGISKLLYVKPSLYWDGWPFHCMAISSRLSMTNYSIMGMVIVHVTCFLNFAP